MRVSLIGVLKTITNLWKTLKIEGKELQHVNLSVGVGSECVNTTS